MNLREAIQEMAGEDLEKKDITAKKIFNEKELTKIGGIADDNANMETASLGSIPSFDYEKAKKEILKLNFVTEEKIKKAGGLKNLLDAAVEYA